MIRRNDPVLVPARYCATLVVIGLLTLPVRADSLTELVDVVYLVEVAGYCSLVDDSVVRGFRRERRRIIDASNFSQSQIESANATAWKMAHAEWQNRGLGGFRAWCRDEGTAAAEHFRNLAGDSP